VSKVIAIAGRASVVLLTWLALALHRAPIEADLVQRTEQGLQPLGIERLRVEARGRDLRLYGNLPPGVEPATARRIAEEIRGVRTVDVRPLRQSHARDPVDDAILALLTRERIAHIGDDAPERPLDLAACQHALAQIAAAGALRVARDTAAPDPGSYPVLNDLAATAARCPDTRIVIAGHTAAGDDADADLRLSRQRAEVVAAFFRIAGIASGRLHAVGYGSTRPVADNATAAGRAANLRMTFALSPLDDGVAEPRSMQ
jgi:hypothetical protein